MSSTRHYLDRVYHHCTRGVLELRTNTGQRRWTALGDWTPLGPFITAAVNAGENVYHGLATRRDPSSGTAENLAEQPMVWVDIDAPPADVRARLDGFPFPYTLMVGSGYGVHVSWEIKEPLDVSAAQALHRAASLQRRLAAYLGADDRCTTPAVAPRLPGTRNFKYGTPRPVTLLDETDATVNACELEDFLPAEVVRANEMTIRASIPTGERNDTLHALARSLRARRLDFSAISVAVRAVNDKLCDEPLDEAEIRRILHYALRPDPHNRPGFIQHPPRPVVVHRGVRR